MDPFRLFTALAAFQLFNKLLSFALNQILMQMFIHNKAMLTLLGRMNVQMEGYFNLVVYLCTESLRQLALKRPVRAAYWLPLCLGVSIVVITLPLQDCLTRFYMSAALIHLAIEGCYIEVCSQGRFRRRLLIDGSTALLRSALLLIQLYHGSEAMKEETLEWIIGRSQLIASCFLGLCYVFSAQPNLYPQTVAFLPELLQQYKTLLLKGILNSLDVILLMLHDVPVNSLNAYSIAVQQYGSLVPRLLFSPLEESCRVHFSKNPDRAVFSRIFRLEFYFTLLIALFGPFYHHIVLDIIIERTHPLYHAVSSLLSLYCWYIPFMGALGLFDAYYSATSKPSSEVFGLSRPQMALICNVILVLTTGPILLAFFPLYGLLITQWVSTMFRLANVLNDLRINPNLPFQIVPLVTTVFITLDIIQGSLPLGVLTGITTLGLLYLIDPSSAIKMHRD